MVTGRLAIPFTSRLSVQEKSVVKGCEGPSESESVNGVPSSFSGAVYIRSDRPPHNENTISPDDHEQFSVFAFHFLFNSFDRNVRFLNH